MSDSQEKYYDIHTTALAYLNRVRLVEPEHGGSPFYSVTLACLRGKADTEGKVPKTYIDTNVVGEAAKGRVQFILDYLEATGDKPDDARILATVKTGDLRLESFTYRNGDKAGQTGYGLKARLLKLGNVMIDGVPIDFGDEDEDRSGTPQADTPDTRPVDSQLDTAGQPAESVQSPPPASMPATGEPDPWLLDSLPDRVRLDKADPKFEQKKDLLKKQGYRWNAQEKLWYRPEAA